jgi:hypothetical protein
MVNSRVQLVWNENEAFSLFDGLGTFQRIAPQFIGNVGQFLRSRVQEQPLSVDLLRDLSKVMFPPKADAEFEEEEELGDFGPNAEIVKNLLTDGNNFVGDWGEFTNSHPSLANLAGVSPGDMTMGLARLAALLAAVSSMQRNPVAADAMSDLLADAEKSSDSC